MGRINLKKNVLLASLIASIPFASPFVIKASSALTGSVVMLSLVEKFMQTKGQISPSIVLSIKEIMETLLDQ